MSEDSVVCFLPQWFRDAVRDQGFTEDDLYEFALMEQRETEPVNDN